MIWQNAFRTRISGTPLISAIFRNRKLRMDDPEKKRIAV